MSIAELLAELEKRSVHLEVHANKLRFHPQSAVPSELVEQLKIHKDELMAFLEAQQADTEPATVEINDPFRNWIETSGDGQSSGIVHPDHLEDQYIDPPDPCEKCGGLMFWWNVFNQQRCMRCEPPKEAIRLLKFKHRIQRRKNIPISPEDKRFLDIYKYISNT